MKQKEELFTNKELKDMIIPLFLEQLLVMLVGLADTLIVSYAGEAAVSGVSLVNQFNTIFIYLFSALASGGAVVISQYIGKKMNETAGKAAGHLFSFSGIFAVIISIFILINDWKIMGMMFGKVDAAVMEACIIYLRILAISYPALAIYNSGISMYRSLGDTKTAMYISVLANVINVIGNIIGVFVLKAGVAGVAYPSLIARVFSAVIITILCFQKKNKVFYRWKWIFSWDGTMIKNILKIAIPNGVENGIFQLVKVALSSVVALFGTYQIAANGVAQSMWSLAALAGLAMAPVFITVIGQCMGQGNIKAAEYYFNKLLKITMLLSIVWNVFTFFLTPVVLYLYALEEETKKMVLMLVLIHNVFNALTYPFMGALSNGLRAAGDVRYTMYVSIVATVIVRLALSYIFGVIFQWGVIGIAIAMCCDWIVKAVVFAWRLKSGKWKRFKVV